MSMNQIKLGYEIDTGEEVFVNPSHLIVTGITQLSGKTTTLEALIKRSGLRAIVFKTKIGEKSFAQGTEVTPFFRDRSDYEFVKSLIEAYAKEKIMIEKGTLMQLCKGSGSLIDIKKRVDDALADGLRGLKEEIHIRLQHYLENLIPQIQYASLSNTLTVYDGVNIMNLERFSEEAQALIIQAVCDEVLKTQKDTVVLIPEAWKFIPQRYNNPCKRAVESFIRQGAANRNFIWIDSQDMAGVDKIPLKQISTWILGYQAERNEVKHTLDQISLPAKDKPKTDEIMTLRKGHFFFTSYDGLKKVYVQPFWLSDEVAKDIALGKTDIDAVVMPNNLTPTTVVTTPQQKPEGNWATKGELIELRSDFFNKIQEIQTGLNNAFTEIYKNNVDTDEIVSLVLQKTSSTGGGVDKESIIKEVIARIPKTAGAVTYEVAPLEKIKKDFLQEAKDKILTDISVLSDDGKKCLKYLEVVNRQVAPNEFVTLCFKLKPGGSASSKVSNALKELKDKELAEKQPNGRYDSQLKDRISSLLSNFAADISELDQVYDHILADLI